IALGAWRFNWLVPGDEIALRIPFAAVELASLLGSTLHDFALMAGGAFNSHANQKWLGVAAIGEATACHELPEATELNHHRTTALLTDLIGRLVADLHLLHRLLGVLERSGEGSVEL